MYPKVRMRVKYILFYVWLLCLTNCAEVNKDFSTPEWTTGAEITAALMETSILVEWPAVDVDDLKEYHVYIEDEVIAVVDGEQLSYRLENLTPAQEYIIAIRARDQAGNFSVAPLRARVRTTDDTPPIWEEPSLTASIIDDSSVLLSWSGARDNVSVSGYLLYRDGILTQRLTTDQESYTWTSLNPGQSYTVTIQSIMVRVFSHPMDPRRPLRSLINKHLHGQKRGQFLSLSRLTLHSLCYGMRRLTRVK